MRHVVIVFALCLFSILGNICFGSEIDRIESRLYLNHSGVLSEPLDDHSELWNVIIGGGIVEPSSSSSSSSTLVDVVSGDPGSYKKWAYVKLIVTNAHTGKIVSQQRKQLGIFSSEGQFHVAFWLLQTGCVPLHLVASLGDKTKSKVVTLPFQCGE